jgi:hypothetical protein
MRLIITVLFEMMNCFSKTLPTCFFLAGDAALIITSATQMQVLRPAMWDCTGKRNFRANQRGKSGCKTLYLNVDTESSYMRCLS